MNYYQITNEKKMDRHLLDLAHAAVEGARDGRISVRDAQKLWAAVKDGHVFTEVEKDTVNHILHNFHWTDGAKVWFHNQLAELEGYTATPTSSLQKLTPHEISLQQFPKGDVLYTEVARQDRLHDLRTAMNETNLDHDDIGLIVRLANGDRVEVNCNFIEMSGDFVELKGGYTIPVRAIEKIEI